MSRSVYVFCRDEGRKIILSAPRGQKKSVAKKKIRVQRLGKACFRPRGDSRAPQGETCSGGATPGEAAREVARKRAKGARCDRVKAEDTTSGKETKDASANSRKRQMIKDFGERWSGPSTLP